MINIIHPYAPERIYAHRQRLVQLLHGHLTNPITVDIDLTDFCDHKCPWCEYAEKRLDSATYLSKEVVLRLLDDLTTRSVKALIFSGGGEPTTYPFFKEVANKIVHNNLKAALFTHGEHIQNQLPYIADAFIYVRVSLDAGSPETYSQSHSHGNIDTFDRIISNIRLLRTMNPTLCLEVSFIITENNFMEIAKLVDMLKDIPIDFMLLKYSRFAADNQWLTSDKLNEIRKQVAESENKLSIYYHDHFLDEKGEFPIERCRTTCLKAVVSPDGNLYICNQRRGDSEVLLGSIYDNVFWKIWKSEEHKRIYSSIDTRKCIPCRHIKYNELLDKIQNTNLPIIKVSNEVSDLVSFL